MTPNVAELIRDHVSLSNTCIDRPYINGYVPTLQTSGQLCYFLREHLGNPIPSPALFRPLHDRFIRSIEQTVKKKQDRRSLDPSPVADIDWMKFQGTIKKSPLTGYRGLFDAKCMRYKCEDMAVDLIGKELLGQFCVLERIGRGGMGEVYKAEQPAMERMVAIKILHAKLAKRADLVSRFRREARAMSRLSHPNTVRVFLYGHMEDTDQLYIVMEYLDGVDLARLVRRDGPMEVMRGIRVMIQVLGALEEAHAVGVVHRDLKPENILLTEQGGMPDFPKVLDFGLAKIHETKLRPGSMILTREGMVFGTPEFMSPEQARGEVLDSRSDIYSVALIFYELVTGRLPFPKSKPMEYISHHINTPPTPISKRNPNIELPERLDPIVARALEKDRESRYQSARDFAEALRTLLPREQKTVAQRAMAPAKPSADETQPLQRQRMGASAPPQKGVGKPVLIGLVAVIVVLLIVILWLFISRPSPPPATVPINAAPLGQPISPSPQTPPAAAAGAMKPLPSRPPASN